ncbi:MAG: hypothetical protein F6K30_24245 [Cyanothece sp. SIO2G6]|nr:hypothetical protein [Cyanothece sp. SIO2G6]
MGISVGSSDISWLNIEYIDVASVYAIALFPYQCAIALSPMPVRSPSKMK